MSYNIVAVMGSYRKKHTYKAVQQFEERLRSRGEFEFEYVWLKDLDLKSCRGCFLCLERGEEFCPGRNDDTQKVFPALPSMKDVMIFLKRRKRKPLIQQLRGLLTVALPYPLNQKKTMITSTIQNQFTRMNSTTASSFGILIPPL